MSAILQNDTTNVLHIQQDPRAVRKMPVGAFKVEKVTSLDALKSKMIDFRALRPAVLSNGVLTVQAVNSRP
jgi:hypothetical protein